jgi:hypothetical protein
LGALGAIVPAGFAVGAELLLSCAIAPDTITAAQQKNASAEVQPERENLTLIFANYPSQELNRSQSANWGKNMLSFRFLRFLLLNHSV